MEMMDIRDFKNEFIDSCRSELLRSGAPELEIEERVVSKAQAGRLTGLCFRAPDSLCAPTLYVEDFYRMYADGHELEDLGREAVDAVIRGLGCGETVPADDFDIRECTDRLRARLIGSDVNSDLLETTPHLKVCDDLALIAYMVSGDFRALVTTELLSEAGMDPDELIEAALACSSEHERPVLYDLTDAVASEPDERQNLLREDAVCPVHGRMFVLSNTDLFWGAGALFYPGVIPALHRVLGGDFYVIPSSVHELILVPADTGDPAHLAEVLHSANRTVVSEEDILSFRLYLCCSGELVPA